MADDRVVCPWCEGECLISRNTPTPMSGWRPIADAPLDARPDLWGSVKGAMMPASRMTFCYYGFVPEASGLMVRKAWLSQHGQELEGVTHFLIVPEPSHG